MHSLVNLAKKSVETFIKTEQVISPPRDLPEEFLNRKSGTFVTIENRGQLRGCIGTYLPIRQNIAEEVIYNAIAAAKEDYRFNPIKEEELSDLSFTVYILNKPELIKNIYQLNPQEYGIIVRSLPIVQTKDEVTFDGAIPYKCGLLLPDLEGINTAEQQVSIACQKAMIDPKKEKFLIYRFTAEKYH
jgi:AmmeMemoRadiSam system protein A